MATEWFCKIMGEEWGPMSQQELVAVARRGRLTRDDNVKRGDQGTWVRAEVVRGLFNSPPIAATVTSDRLVAAVQRAAPAKRSVVLSIDPMRYWIKIGQVGTRVAGPFSADRVRQFAEQGVLKPFHLVSNDRRHWYRAVDARGMVFGGAAASAKTISARSSVWLEQPVLSSDSSTATVDPSYV
jgi:GYF domain 2